MADTSVTSPTYRLADRLLENGIKEFVLSRRDARVSWRNIARALLEATDHEIDVTHETLRSWFPEAA